MNLPNKVAVRDALLRELERALATLAKAAQQTREGATHEDSRAEGDKDMRSTEQSYLARGQAMRVEDLAEQLQRLAVFELPRFGQDAPIAAGALIGVLVEDAPRILFLVAFGGGSVLQVEGQEVTVVTPSSPVGRALLGKQTGDSFELPSRGALREWVIEEVT